MYDNHTEILTVGGWKLCQDLTMDDAVATLDKGYLLYQLPSELRQEDYAGSMAKIATDRLQLQVTPNHFIYCSGMTRAGRQQYKFRKAWNVARAHFTCAFDWVPDTIPDVFHIPAHRATHTLSYRCFRNVDMADWFTFVGWYVSEGSHMATEEGSKTGLVISQSRLVNPVKWQEIRELFTRMGLQFRAFDMGFQLSGGQLVGLVHDCGRGAYNKQIPDWMLRAPQRYLQCLYDALMKGDGSGCRRYYTASSKLADQFQELALKLGKAANCSLNTKLLYTFSLSDKQEYMVYPSHASTVQYTGKVYAIKTPVDTPIMTRRFGTCCWC